MRFKVKGENSIINHSWIDEQGQRQAKLFRVGEELPSELAPQQVDALRHQLEPLDDDAKALIGEAAPVNEDELRGMRGHEKVGIIKQRVESLEVALDTARAQLKAAEAQEKQETELRAARTRKPEVPSAATKAKA